MLIDFENTGYITVCETPEIVPVEEKNVYIPASTWGFIRGDIKEQSDLISLLTTIESGLTPEQIKLLVDTDSRFEDVEKSVIELDAKNTNEYVEINLILDTKADAADVYSKLEIDNKGYLTEHQSLTGYATEQWVTEKNYLTEHQSLEGLATENWVNDQLTLKANADSVYTKTEVDSAISNVEVDLTGYATEQWVNNKGYLTEHQSLADYYTKTEIDNKGYLTEHQSLAGLASENWVKEQNYLTEHQSLADYYTKTEVDSAISNVEVDLTGYATETYVDTAVESKVDISKIWTGTQDEWDDLSDEIRNSYIIAMIEI